MIAGIDRHRRTAQVHDLAQIVETMGVIRVLVCPDDGVDLADARVEQLQPHIGAGVDKNTEAAERYHDRRAAAQIAWIVGIALTPVVRSEEHTSELQSLMRISYAVFC